jgi:hypothetical protein
MNPDAGRPPESPSKIRIKFYPTERGWARCSVCDVRIKLIKERLEQHALNHVKRGDR